MCPKMLFGSTPSAPKPAPSKTDADIAQSALRRRQALALSTNGLQSLFSNGNDDDPQVKRITLGV